jgi:hypothetical protein
MFRNQQPADFSQSPLQPSRVAMDAAGGAAPQSSITVVPLRYGTITDAKGQQISEIRLRAPTAGDWMECGDFQTTKVLKGEDGEAGALVFEVDTKSVEKWLPRLTGIPLPLLRPLDYRDFRNLFNALAEKIGPYTKGN